MNGHVTITVDIVVLPYNANLSVAIDECKISRDTYEPE